MSMESREDTRAEAQAREVLAQEVRRQITRKEHVVATSGRHGATDVTPVLRIRRDGHDVAVATCADVDRDQALRFLSAAIPGYAADEILMTTDAHVTTAPLNPKTGKPWGPHEMQGLCDNEGACATGLITDTIAVFMLTRDGHAHLASAPYHVHKTAKTVAWVAGPDIMDSDPGSSETRLEGFVPDSIRAFFERPAFSFNEAIKVGVDPAAARRLADAALSELLAATGVYVVELLQDG